MAKRGRPRHPDILTPREWEVLALVREGLTNEQIAERLGTTERTARYHVSEILSKLGVSTRQEAAAWQPDERRSRWPLLLAPLAVWRRGGLAWVGASLAATLLLVTVVGLGLLGWGLMRTRGQTANPAPPTAVEPMPVDVAAKEPDQYVIAYVVPVSSAPLATLYVRTIDAPTGNADPDLEVGLMYRAQLVRSNTPVVAAAPRLVAFGPLLAQAHVMYLDNGQSIETQVIEDGSSPTFFDGTASVGDIMYGQEGDAIVGRNTNNQVVASYPVAKPLPPRGDEPIFTTPTKGIFSSSKASVSTIVPTSAGHLLAFVEGLTNSVLADLDTGQRLDLVGYDRVFAAPLAKDGYVYALVHNTWFPDAGFEVMKIDPVALRLVAQQPMDFNWRTQLPNGFFALAAPGGGVYIYIPLLSAESLLYHVAPDTAATTLVPLPPALGIDASVGVDGKLYFYGGVGENRVARYDPATRQLETDVPALRAPDGTYVEAVIAR
jgi:DNA-binding CsgD family transcriptional regulator